MLGLKTAKAPKRAKPNESFKRPKSTKVTKVRMKAARKPAPVAVNPPAAAGA
jgi:hypothetical protein